MASILVVDGDASARRMTQHTLHAAGHTVAAVQHAHQAVTQLIRTPCDLLVMELLAPQFNGFALLHALRTHQHYCDVRVLVVTNSASARDRERALQIGATCYLTKPVSSAALVAAVQRMLQQHGVSSAPLPQQHSTLTAAQEGFADMLVAPACV